MRHLRKFNEDIKSKFKNDQEISDLRESLLEVSDKLGEPTINTFQMGNLIGYVIQYSIPIATIGEMTTDVFYEAIDTLYSTKNDILQTADRFSDRFQTTISQNAGKLKIRLTPITKQEGGYKFFTDNQGGRGIEIDGSEVRRWAVDNGLTISKVNEEYDEGAEMGDLSVEFSGSSENQKLPELVMLLNEQKDAIIDSFNRDFEIDSQGNTLYITCLEEKMYIDWIER